MQQYDGVRCVASCVLQVCGARSCPPINVYQAATLELSLDFATRAFFSDPASFRIDTSTRVPTVWLSKILCWYVVWTQECGVVGWVVCLVHSPLLAVRCHCLLCDAIACCAVPLPRHAWLAAVWMFTGTPLTLVRTPLRFCDGFARS